MSDSDEFFPPDEHGWQQLCEMAERQLDADPEAFERDWLPHASARCAAWPPALRRCPDAWFTTPRVQVARLLSLCRVTDDELAAWGLEHGDHGWTLLARGEPEFTFPGNDPPRPEALVVVPYVLKHWAELETRALAKFHEFDFGASDPHVDLRRRPPSGRWASGGLVEILEPPHFGLHIDDECWSVNSWPYGQWVATFRWGRLAQIEQGYEHRVLVWRD